MKLPTVSVVEAHQNIAARFGKAADAGKGAPRIIGMMQHTIANYKVEEAVP